MHLSNISNTILTRWKVAGEQPQPKRRHFLTTVLQQQYSKARISRDSNTEIRKQTTASFSSVAVWPAVGQRTGTPHRDQAVNGQMNPLGSLFSFPAAYHLRVCFIYGLNHAFYVPLPCVALFGETVETATPFRVVFNEVCLPSKLKILCLWKVCGKANKLYSSVSGTSDQKRLSDLPTQ